MDDERMYVDFSIVLAAMSNNPTILNPDFLKYNGIVDNSFNLKQSPICTEPFSRIVYQNDISITAQLDKVVFSIKKASINKEEFDSIYNISKHYIKCIPHVNYLGIGINAAYIIKFKENNSPNEFIITRFMNSEIAKRDLLGIGFNQSFNVNENAICFLDVSAGKSVDNRGKKEAIIIHANFHHDITKDISKKIDMMNSILDSYKDDISFFENEIISKYFLSVRLRQINI